MSYRRSLVSLLVSGALAAAILSCSAVGSLPNPFASATPTATATHTPTSTPSPTPTPTLTPTPLPSGVTVQILDSGQALVQDWDNDFQLVLPPKWVAISLSKQELDRLIEREAAADPEFARFAEAFQKMDPGIIRIFGLHGNRKYRSAQYPTLVLITALSEPVLSGMPMAFITAFIEDHVLTGSKETTWDVKTNSHGVEVGIVQGPLQVRGPQGKEVRTQCKIFVFAAGKKLVMVQFITPTQFAAEVLPAADQIIETIQRAGGPASTARVP